MIDAFERGIAVAHRQHVGGLAALDHDHRDPQPARSRDLSISCGSATVLGDDDVDAMSPKQIDLVRFGKWAGGKDRRRVRQFQGRGHRVDAADDVAVLRRSLEMKGLLPADGEKDTARGVAKGHDRLRNGADAGPVVAGFRLPLRALQGEQAHPRSLYRRGGVLGNPGGEGVCRVDDQRDLFGVEEGCEPLGAAKTADAGLDWLRARIGRTAGKRDHGVVTHVTGKAGCQFAGLGRPAKNENARFFHG